MKLSPFLMMRSFWDALYLMSALSSKFETNIVRVLNSTGQADCQNQQITGFSHMTVDVLLYEFHMLLYMFHGTDILSDLQTAALLADLSGFGTFCLWYFSFVILDPFLIQLPEVTKQKFEKRRRISESLTNISRSLHYQGIRDRQRNLVEEL